MPRKGNDEIDYSIIAINIKKLRQDKNMSQDELALKTGFSKVHISNIENEHTTISLAAIVTIANALETTVDEILGENVNAYNPKLERQITDWLTSCSPDDRGFISDQIQFLIEEFKRYDVKKKGKKK